MPTKRDPDHQFDSGSLLESLADERQVSAAETARRLSENAVKGTS